MGKSAHSPPTFKLQNNNQDGAMFLLVPKDSLIEWGVYSNEKENKAGNIFNLKYNFRRIQNYMLTFLCYLLH